MHSLLSDIEAFCTTHKLAESSFGLQALDDKNLIPDLRGDKGKRPRRLWPETEGKVRRFMATYRPTQADAA